MSSRTDLLVRISELYYQQNLSQQDISKITGILGEKNINIIDIRAPQNLSRTKSMAIIKTNIEVPQIMVDKIKEEIGALNAFTFQYQA